MYIYIYMYHYFLVEEGGSPIFRWVHLFICLALAFFLCLFTHSFFFSTVHSPFSERFLIPLLHPKKKKTNQRSINSPFLLLSLDCIFFFTLCIFLTLFPPFFFLKGL